MRNSWKVAALCTPEYVAGLDDSERDYLIQWMGHLVEPEAGRAVMRVVLANAGSMTRDAVADFVTAPIRHPGLVLAGTWGSKFAPCASPEARTRRPKTAAEHFGPVDHSAPSNAIVNRASDVLSEFGIGDFEHCVSYMVERGDAAEKVRKRASADVAALVKADAVDQLRLMADIRMEPLPVALMHYDGGPKCRALILRPEAYEGNEAGRDLLATFAVMCMQCDRAMDLLQSLEDVTPGYLRTVKDAAGHNLLWYLGFRKTLRARSLDKDEGMASRAVRNFLMKKAKCDTVERDVFGLSWQDVRDGIWTWGLSTCCW